MKYPTVLVKYSPVVKRPVTPAHQGKIGAAKHTISIKFRHLKPLLTALACAFSLVSAAAADSCPAALWPYEVQGPGSASPLEGEVIETRGTVTFTDYRSNGLRGFFIQGPTDHDSRTSEALFVFAPGHRPARGTEVVVHGEVKEFHGLTEITNVRSVKACGEQAIPDPMSLGEPDEPLENMRVQLPATRIVDNYRLFDVGELVISDGEYEWTLEDGSNDRRLDAIPWGLVQDPTLVANGRTLAPITGVLTWRWGRWVVLPDNPPAVTSDRNWDVPPPPEGALRVTSFNIENLFNGDDGRFAQSRGAENASEWAQQRRKVANAIMALDTDLFLLQEMQHDHGSATPVMEEMTEKLNRMDDRQWEAIAPKMRPGEDAITNAFLYDPDQLSPNGPLKSIDTEPRPALVQSFTRADSNKTFYVINVHLKSRGWNCDDICEEDREASIAEIMHWLDDHQTEDPWFFGGDFNTLTDESLWSPLHDSGWTFGEVNGPTYWFRGRAQQIDHFWYRNLSTEPTLRVQPGHAEMPPMPYLHPLYDPDSPWGASDHNPVILDW